jgi:hypothetical protein
VLLVILRDRAGVGDDPSLHYPDHEMDRILVDPI